MLIGNFKGVEFTYHHNILVNNETSFDDYYNSIKGHINKLYQEGYEIHDVMNFNMRVWNMDSVNNKKIKITKTSAGNKISDLKILKRSFSTNTYIENKKVVKPLQILPIPVNVHHKNIVNTFAAIDIETMENPANGNQTAIAISLVFEDPANKCLIKKLFINKEENELFKSFFEYINSEEFINANIRIIFAHNLGNFDGLFLLRGMLKVVEDIKDLNSLIDHHNKFILIKYKNNKPNSK